MHGGRKNHKKYTLEVISTIKGIQDEGRCMKVNVKPLVTVKTIEKSAFGVSCRFDCVTKKSLCCEKLETYPAQNCSYHLQLTDLSRTDLTDC